MLKVYHLKKLQSVIKKYTLVSPPQFPRPPTICRRSAEPRKREFTVTSKHNPFLVRNSVTVRRLTHTIFLLIFERFGFSKTNQSGRGREPEMGINRVKRDGW